MKSTERIDWSQLWYPGPTRRFSAEEMARAGGDRPSATLVAAAWANAALVAFMLLLHAPPATAAVSIGMFAAAAVLGLAGTRRLWREPTRRALAVWSALGTAAMVALSVGVVYSQGLARGEPGRAWVLFTGLGLALVLSVVWWFVAIYRAQQIEARLRELADQQRVAEMARQLAAAQIQPHFLFNSLAALQHWVQTKDDRAAPLLDALGAFLRATLPLFHREQLALGEEAQAVREYLQVMRLRLGPRLQAEVDISADAAAVQVPPGLLLTLVENALEHGVAPSLDGARVQVQAQVAAGRLQVAVHDTGPGLAPGWREGLGLANSRLRLQQLHGSAAQLVLEPAAGGGCVARFEMPWQPVAAPARGD